MGSVWCRRALLTHTMVRQILELVKVMGASTGSEKNKKEPECRDETDLHCQLRPCVMDAEIRSDIEKKQQTATRSTPQNRSG